MERLSVYHDGPQREPEESKLEHLKTQKKEKDTICKTSQQDQANQLER